MRRVAGQIQDKRQRATAPVRGGHPAAGGRHALVAAGRPEHCAVRAGRVRRVLERPAPKARAVHVDTGGQRAGPRRWPRGLRLLVQRTPHGSGRPRRGGAHVTGRRQDGSVQRDVQLRRRCHRCKFKTSSAVYRA